VSELLSRITGTGSALPERVLTNHDLERMVDTSDQWIQERTGIRERRIAEEGDKLSDYAVRAAEAALSAAGLEGPDVDMIVCATVTPDWHLPATACFIQERLGAKGPAFDLSAGCSGFLYALAAADSFLRTGAARRVLVIGGELLSKYVNWQDRGTCVIFADGAGAVVLERREGERGVLETRLHADGRMADFISIPGGGTQHPPSHSMIDEGLHLIHMKGNETFKIAIRSLTSVCREVLEARGLGPKDVDLFVPHQANVRIINAVGDRLGVDADHTYLNIERVGNTSAASIPLALDEAVRAGRVAEGDLLLFAAFGAGLTWGASLVRW
jgi:3-oxoacyl-[acyl-carrier-protein] synthase-3